MCFENDSYTLLPARALRANRASICVQAWNRRLLKPLRLRILHTTGTLSNNHRSHYDVFSYFQVPQTQNALQFIPYDGPPKPKQTSRPSPLKMLPDENDCSSINEVQDFRDKERGIVPTSHGDDVIDLTCLGKHPRS